MAMIGFRVCAFLLVVGSNGSTENTMESRRKMEGVHHGCSIPTDIQQTLWIHMAKAHARVLNMGLLHQVAESRASGSISGLGYCPPYCPPQQQSIVVVLLRAIKNHIIIIIQLLLRGGSTQIRTNYGGDLRWGERA